MKLKDRAVGQNIQHHKYYQATEYRSCFLRLEICTDIAQ